MFDSNPNRSTYLRKTEVAQRGTDVHNALVDLLVGLPLVVAATTAGEILASAHAAVVLELLDRRTANKHSSAKSFH
jgi:hypothetical protein